MSGGRITAIIACIFLTQFGILPQIARLPLAPARAVDDVADAADVKTAERPDLRTTKVDFGREIRPILADKCFACHGPDEPGRKAMLRLDQPPAVGESSAILPGKPDQSPLLQRITAVDDDQRMPPPESGKQLTPVEIELLRRWIVQGAPYDAHWAYARLRPPSLPASGASARCFVDAWVDQRLREANIAPAAEAPRRTLARRLAWDLLGLPVEVEEVVEFQDDESPDAYERFVDRLLARPQYGERLAMFWLDLVRYADTVGYHGDQDHHASPYRDYVIDAFNQGMPFDQFTIEQLAGDLLPAPTPEQLTATCYNRLLQTSHEGGVQAKEYLAMYAADRVRNLSGTWLGATIGCAQCHDHKFDPITSREFYELAAFFADVDEERHLRGEGGDTSPTRRPPEINVQGWRERESPRKIERQVMVTQSLAKPRVTRVLPRGSWQDESGPIVVPNVPRVLGVLAAERRATRLDLAHWLTDPQQGAGALTARVLANRLWQLFFGAGISKSLDDFGAQGESPTNPELLESLGTSLIESSWDVKAFVRRLVTSQTYRRSAAASATAKERDPDNRLFSHQNSWRLPAESIRDTGLRISGLWNAAMGGDPVRPYQPEGYYRHLNFPKREYVADVGPNQWRRGVYMHWQRQFLHPMLRAFDAPSREECTAQRPRSNTPLAALVLLNDPTFIECARGLATETLRRVKSDDRERLSFAFWQATAREPTRDELQVLESLLQANLRVFAVDEGAARRLLGVGLSPVATEFAPAELAGWTATCRLLLNLSETMTRE
ncbi:MAG: PSD1 and planctomycete cytochrome C domain-containing protein [Pirellulales bacterium]